MGRLDLSNALNASLSFRERMFASATKNAVEDNGAEEQTPPLAGPSLLARSTMACKLLLIYRYFK